MESPPASAPTTLAQLGGLSSHCVILLDDYALGDTLPEKIMSRKYLEDLFFIERTFKGTTDWHPCERIQFGEIATYDNWDCANAAMSRCKYWMSPRWDFRISSYSGKETNGKKT